MLRARLPGQSWKQVRQLTELRHARVNGELCLDPARRLKEGETVELLSRPVPRPRQADVIVLRHLDELVVVVEKPSGISTVRNQEFALLSPTGRTMIVYQPDDSSNVIDLLLVTDLETKADAAPQSNNALPSLQVLDPIRFLPEVAAENGRSIGWGKNAFDGRCDVRVQ